MGGQREDALHHLRGCGRRRRNLVAVLYPIAQPEEKVAFATIRYAVACWLRYRQQCPLVCFERGGHGWAWGHPDVFGVTASRATYDIEIKMSLADFKADASKKKFSPVAAHFPRPTWFYYACGEKLAEKILPLLPDGAGLMVVRGFREFGQDGVMVMKNAIRHKGERPGARQVVEWAKDQSGTVCGLAKQVARMIDKTTDEFPK